MATHAELTTKNKQVKAQVNGLEKTVESISQEKESLITKEHAINALNEALASGSGEHALEALDSLKTLPEDVDHVKNALWDLLSNQKELSQKNAELEATLRHFGTPQSTVALHSQRKLTYAELLTEYKQVEAQVSRLKQMMESTTQEKESLMIKERAINALNQALASGSGERVLEALDGLETLPEDVDHVKHALVQLLTELRRNDTV